MHGFAGDNGNLVFSFICTLLALYQLYALFERTLCKKALETHTHTRTPSQRVAFAQKALKVSLPKETPLAKKE